MLSNGHAGFGRGFAGNARWQHRNRARGPTSPFEVFPAMVIGLIAATTARWQVDQIGLTLFDLVLNHFVADGAYVPLAVDDTAHRRRGRKVHGAGWIHDGSAPARNKLAFGHRWVVVGVIVRPSFLSRPLCLPVLCRRWQGKAPPPPWSWRHK